MLSNWSDPSIVINKYTKNHLYMCTNAYFYIRDFLLTGTKSPLSLQFSYTKDL